MKKGQPFSMKFLCFYFITLVAEIITTPLGAKEAGVAIAAGALVSKLAEDECDDVGVSFIPN